MPQAPEEPTQHKCINLRLNTDGGHYAWEFEREGRRVNVRVDGQLALNSSSYILPAVLAGHGLGCIPEDMAAPHFADGSLVQVLQGWMPTFSGYHLYYPSRRQSAGDNRS